MSKVFYFGCLYFILILLAPSNNEKIYDDIFEDENEPEYTEYDNGTEEYDVSTGRDEQLFGDIRPAFPINHFHSSGSQNYLQDLINHQLPKKRPGLKIRRKKIGKRGYKYLIPLLLSVLAKVAHFLPLVKLTLLALFALVLFSKKALLVSIGSLVLVIYDTFYKNKQKGMNLVRDRGSTVPTVEHGSLPEDSPDFEEGWWGREEIRPDTKLHSHEDEHHNKKLNRWWAPQVNFKKQKYISLPKY